MTPADCQGYLSTRNDIDTDDMIILVVEDDLLVLDVFESMLKSHGHDVIAAPDPSTASMLLEVGGRPPDVLLVDVALVGASGIDYATALRTQYPTVGIVFTTGFAHREAPARRSGMGEVLRKPFRPAELFASIDRASRQRPA